MSNKDFFALKIRTLFNRFDMDLNGKIEEDDFYKWCEKLIAIGNLDTNQSDHLRKSLRSIWLNYFLPADTDNDGSVMEIELVTHMQESLDDEIKRQAITNTLPLIFDAIDSNQDDGVSIDEFSNYFKSLSLFDSKFAGDVFAAMDANNDGSLSKEEFSAFGEQFFLSNDQSSPARFFFGPLVE